MRKIIQEEDKKEKPPQKPKKKSKKKLSQEDLFCKIIDTKLDEWRERFYQREKAVQDTALKLQKSLDKYEKKLKDVTDVNISVRDTLSNVLLAIRQNEYLQAWYPAQSGYPEMKVVGQHPKRKRST